MTSAFGKGIAFPPRVDANGRMLWSEGERNIEESISIILKTDPNERVGQPRFGTGLTAFLFEPNNAATHARIAHAIDGALRKWEPRIAVETVDVAVLVTTSSIPPMSYAIRACTSPVRVRVKNASDIRCRCA